MDCIFCQIIEDKIPAEKVHDDDDVVAFLDINPVAPGHTLILPKKHHETLLDMPAELMQKVSAVSQKIAAAVKKATEAEGFNYLANNHKCAGQAIPHAHIHIIPRAERDGLGYRWKTGSYPAGRAETLRNDIRDALNA